MSQAGYHAARRTTREGAVRRIVTISARYGAGGSVVGPAVAEALGMPFFDRVVAPGADDRQPVEVRVGASEAAREEERTGGLWARVLESFAHMPAEPSTGIVPVITNDQALRTNAEQHLRQVVEGSDCVVLGWASAVVIEDGFHVRLEGPRRARIRQAMAIEPRLTEEEAARQLDETDRIRSLYWRRLYGKDFSDLSRYHLVLDSTAIHLGVVEDLIVTAARAFWAGRAG
jgi:cytidylate kinase